MRRAHRLLFCTTFFFVLMLSTSVHAQQWAGIIDPSRAIDWSKAGVRGGIPARLTVCKTLNPGASAAQISAAIAACPSGQTVFLSAGTYNLSGGIAFTGTSGVTLRGAGANQTFLVFSNGGGCHGLVADICLDSVDTSFVAGPSNTANWTAGYAQGATAITLDNFANLKVGSPLLLDQNDDATDPGNIFNCQSTSTSPPCSLEGNTNNGQRPNRDEFQVVEVVACGTANTPGAACNGGNITISPGLYMPNWASGRSPGAWWATGPVSGDGVENLSMDNSSSSGFRGVEIFNCIDCWVSGVRGIKSGRSHVEILQSARVTIQNSYFYLTQNAVSQSYGISPYGSADVLAQNNIFQYVSTPLQINGCTGCVLSYNYAINTYSELAAGFLVPSIMAHTAGDNFILVEGNVAPQFYGDVFHGTHNFMTFFRNQFIGNQPVCFSGSPNSFAPCTSNLNAMVAQAYNREFNIIGNVLGQVGTHTTYQGSFGNKGIYDIGSGNTEASVRVQPDPLVATTLMRWGNYDTVSGVVRFLNAEVPSGQSPYGNAVPASQSLPASFYLNAKPSFFAAAKPFPPIGPDINGGNVSGVAGHVNSIPAQDCYTSVMGGPADGTGSVLSFNASNCYGTSGATLPAPPSGLQAVVK
jgi:hypothetical protein